MPGWRFEDRTEAGPDERLVVGDQDRDASRPCADRRRWRVAAASSRGVSAESPRGMTAGEPLGIASGAMLDSGYDRPVETGARRRWLVIDLAICAAMFAYVLPATLRPDEPDGIGAGTVLGQPAPPDGDPADPVAAAGAVRRSRAAGRRLRRERHPDLRPVSPGRGRSRRDADPLLAGDPRRPAAGRRRPGARARRDGLHRVHRRRPRGQRRPGGHGVLLVPALHRGVGRRAASSGRASRWPSSSPRSRGSWSASARRPRRWPSRSSEPGSPPTSTPPRGRVCGS